MEGQRSPHVHRLLPGRGRKGSGREVGTSDSSDIWANRKGLALISDD